MMFNRVWWRLFFHDLLYRLRKFARPHQSPPKTRRPMLNLTMAFCLGLIIENYYLIPMTTVLSLSVISLILWGLTKNFRWSGCICMLLFVTLGMARLGNEQMFPDNHLIHVLRYRNVTEAVLQGVVVSDVQERPYFKRRKTMFVMEADRLERRGFRQNVKGKVQVQIFRKAELKYGDRVALTGKIYRPFDYSDEKFSYRDYLRRQGIFHIFSVGRGGEYSILKEQRGVSWAAASYKVKRRLAETFTKYLTDNESALMIGMNLGDRYFIPRHINELFVRTGTSHILAISGFNVGIVAFIVLLAVKTIIAGRWFSHIVTILILIFYAFLTGGQSSVVRATIMATVFLMSFVLERESEPLNSLALSALLILIVRPMGFFEVGFQLSYVCVLSILYITPVMMALIPRSLSVHPSMVIQFFLRSVIVSLAVWLGVSGLIAYYFQILTPITILANLVIVPLSTVLIILGLGMLAVAFVCGPAVVFFSLCIKVVLNVMIGCIFLFSQLPWAYFYLAPVPLEWVGLYYVVLISALCVLKRILPPRDPAQLPDVVLDR